MDIDQANFRRHLLSILKHIASANFITFDLEMSGITTRPKYSMGDRSHDINKPTLQQQYDEMRSAAETFQVLQIGITCVEEDHEREYYLARPYNFNLSPLSAAGVDLKLDRKLTFSSSSCDFLLKNRFDFGKVFTSGVPYLSQREEAMVREEYMDRQERNSTIPDISISPYDMAAAAFYRDARNTIKTWADNPKAENDFVNISSEDGPLNAYQRRLIHQLVRNDFPDLRTFARNEQSFMQVVKVDMLRESEHQKRKMVSFDSAIAKQTGLRWVFEALTGGDLSGIDPRWFYAEGNEKPEHQLSSITRELRQVTETLRNKTHIIVGHNMFTDLGFIYNTFISSLPAKVCHFQECIHGLFPVVIDTKYLATHGNDSMNPRTGLKDTLEPFKKVHIPLICLHEKHTAYGTAFGKEHEAGFDSWMTAELFVKLAAKLHAEQQGLVADPESDDSSLNDKPTSDNEGGGVPLNYPDTDGRSDSDIPPEWYAQRLNRSSIVVEGPDQGSDKNHEPTPALFIPSMSNKFWRAYINKLRVTAVEGGVCDLNKGDY
ncbi:Ribonuclease H-like protein [Venustampulla echinocandica]|uniref:Poly(A)-specific ribonuclease PARN n=1 Tax=Venustampulla echinocandica TaxID=2656787 RepID=A0A370TGX7_9HELO|nr:Ribonuclease H-like protein [Venustampulla echinocandica]RDL34454.1 Ribonuclease H-like protein [Venustampulla echinocandica]